MKPIVVHACLSVNPAEEARLQLHAAAAALHVQAADAHAEGMFLEGQSVRVEQLASILSDEEAIRIRNMFAEEGVIEIDYSSELDMTSPGGDA